MHIIDKTIYINMMCMKYFSDAVAKSLRLLEVQNYKNIFYLYSSYVLNIY